MGVDVGSTITWSAVGLLAGSALTVASAQLLTALPETGAAIREQRPAVWVTAALFGLLAWRFDQAPELLFPYSYLAAVGVAASSVDVAAKRLPRELLLPGYVTVGIWFAGWAVATGDYARLLRAITAAILVGGLYLIIAVASRGGLGAGDVRLGALLGLGLGWLSWAAIPTGILLGWLSAAAAIPLYKTSISRGGPTLIPLGPFLIFGFFASLVATHRY